MATLPARDTAPRSQRASRESPSLCSLHIRQSCLLASFAHTQTAANEPRPAHPRNAEASVARKDAPDPAPLGHKARKILRTPHPNEASLTPPNKSAIASAFSSPCSRPDARVRPVEQQIRHEISRHQK